MGTRIAEARRKKGLTQAQVAEKLDVSFQAVSSWERDEYIPDTKNLIALSELLDISLAALTSGRTFDFSTTDELFNWEHMKTFIRATAGGLGMANTLKAMDTAVKAHEGQTRKNSEVPYIYHPLLLACHCLAMGIRDDEIIAACLLHDVIEDCGLTAEDLPVSEGTKKLVCLMTHEDDESRREAILDEYYGALAADPKGALIKCVDRCHNMTSIAWGLSKEKRYRYIEETEKYIPSLLETLKNTPEFNSISWLLKYQMTSMLDIYKRLI